MHLKPETRYILAMAVVEDAEKLSDPLIAALTTAIGTKSGPAEGVKEPEDISAILIMREHDVPAKSTIGQGIVVSLSAKMLGHVVDVYEQTGNFDLLDAINGEFAIICALGDVEFCQAFVHLVCTKDDGTAPSWGMHYIRQLTSLGKNAVLWYDTAQPDDYFREDLVDLVGEFVETLQT